MSRPSATTLSGALSYSDTDIVVFGRFAGESNDCTQTQFKRTVEGGNTAIISLPLCSLCAVLP